MELRDVAPKGAHEWRHIGKTSCCVLKILLLGKITGCGVGGEPPAATSLLHYRGFWGFLDHDVSSSSVSVFMTALCQLMLFSCNLLTEACQDLSVLTLCGVTYQKT